MSKESYSAQLRDLLQTTVNCMILAAYAKSADITARELIAKNPHCPASILRILAKDKVWNIRAIVASNPNCTEPLFQMLAEDHYDRVRLYVVTISNCPLRVLQFLATNDLDSFVRTTAASAIRTREMLRKRK
jgi:hypothetical protein